MKKTLLLYGAIAGVVIIVAMAVGTTFSADGDSSGFSEAFGYLTMIVALSVIFVGIKRYRDRELGGVIRFGPALVLGLGISLMASIAYVISWEIYLALTDHAFIGAYTASMIEAGEAAGVSGAELEALKTEMAELQQRYANPLLRLPITFVEIFPVGLIISLLSAALLRNSRFLPATSEHSSFDQATASRGGVS